MAGAPATIEETVGKCAAAGGEERGTGDCVTDRSWFVVSTGERGAV